MTALAVADQALVTLAEVIASAPEGQQVAPGVKCWFAPPSATVDDGAARGLTPTLGDQAGRPETTSPGTRAAPPTQVRKPAVPASGGEGQEPARAGGDVPPAPVSLDELPDYVDRLLTQIDRLLARVEEQDAELTALRARERAWSDVERRVQAVIARRRR